MLTAYVAGKDVAIRIGAAVKGGFHHGGFHATAICAHFGAALIAGRLYGLDAAQLAAAQGIETVITNGRHPEALYGILQGKSVGTLFAAEK